MRLETNGNRRKVGQFDRFEVEQLIDAASGHHLWAERYDLPHHDGVSAGYGHLQILTLQQKN